MTGIGAANDAGGEAGTDIGPEVNSEAGADFGLDAGGVRVRPDKGGGADRCPRIKAAAVVCGPRGAALIEVVGSLDSDRVADVRGERTLRSNCVDPANTSLICFRTVNAINPFPSAASSFVSDGAIV